MTSYRIVLACGLAAALAPGAAAAWELSGVKQIARHTRAGQDIQIGTVTFTPTGTGPASRSTSTGLGSKTFSCR